MYNKCDGTVDGKKSIWTDLTYSACYSLWRKSKNLIETTFKKKVTLCYIYNILYVHSDKSGHVMVMRTLA